MTADTSLPDGVGSGHTPDRAGNARSTLPLIELDIATAVSRLEQIADRRARYGDDDGLADHLWDRVMTIELMRVDL